MKIKDIRDINCFLSKIDKYEGKVKLVTEQGDCMNLSGILARYVAMVKIINDNTIREGKIIFENN